MAERSEQAARVWLPPPASFLAFTIAGVGVQWGAWHLQFHVPWLARAIAACIDGLAGAVLLACARTLLRRTGQDPRPWKPSPEMILRGPYRFSRNPMYLGMLLVQVSIGLALDNPWVVLSSPAALLVVHFTAVLPEERYLSERFADAYV